MNNKDIKTHIDKSRRLLDEVINTGENGGENKAKTRLLKVIYELETAREAVQSLLTELEESKVKNELTDMLNSSASGTVEMIGSNWLHLRLETNLPGDKNHVEVKRVSNTVTNLLDCYAGYLGYLPQYEQAFVAIIEYANPVNVTRQGAATAFDNDNKGYRAIPNALKGRLFEDDNQFIMSLGLFTVDSDEDSHCDIYIIPIEDVADFTAQFLVF